MKTGIVILNYNDADTVITLVNQIKEYNSIDKIIIVDNNSKDNSYKKLHECYAALSKIDVVLADKNGGYSYGNNYGVNILIKKYGCKYVFIANPDVYFSEDTIMKITGAFDEDAGEQYGVLSAVMTKTDGSDDQAPYRNIFTFMHDVGDCFLLVRRLRYEKQVFKVDYSKTIMDVEVIQGSFFAIRSNVFEKIGGLDENVFLYSEEMILAKKLQNAGYKTGLLTSQKYIHNHAVSINKSLNRMNIWKNVIQSKYYYQTRYNNIKGFPLVILRYCQSFSMLEKKLIEVFRKM